MKRIAMGLAALLIGAGAAAADPIEGVWQTIKDDNGNFGHIQISACGAKFCGVLIRAFDSSGAQIDSENVGRQLVWDMEPKGDGAYRNGKVYSPDRGKTYNGKIDVNGNQATVKGCLFKNSGCRTGGVWTRVN